MIILSHVYRNLQAHTSVFPEYDLVKLTTSSLPRRTLAVEGVSDLAGTTVCVTAQPEITLRDLAVLLS